MKNCGLAWSSPSSRASICRAKGACASRMMCSSRTPGARCSRRWIRPSKDATLSEKKSAKKKLKEAAAPGEARGPMDVGLLQQLVALMAANDLNTVDLRDGGQRIVLKRGAATKPVMSYTPMPLP